ncbi:MAG: PfkB family carbohydrate kinase [Deltaproteobacteria bacterium]|nr:PfkB family carbohydrate kinase [Deltaproteobacteria bacterium]
MKIAAPLPPDQIAAMLRSLTDVSVVVVGDFGFDAYLHLETLPGETSQETGRPIEAVRRFAYDPAGAANVAVNLVALGVRDVRAVGVVGDDLHGRELVRALGMRGIDTSGFVTQTGGWQTVVYAKPHRDGIEGTRIDFGEFNELGAETNAEMLRRFREALRGEPAVIFNQQVRRGVLEPSNIVDFVGAAAGAVTIADSRHHARAFDGCRLS